MKDFQLPATFLNDKRYVSLGLWAGIISPFFFVFIFTIDGFLHPTYSQMTQMVSFLSVQAQNGWIQIANFIICGLMLIAFAGGFFQTMSSIISKKALIAVTILIALAGSGLINEGFNNTGLSGQPLGIHGILHLIGFFVIFGSLTAAALITGQKLLKIAAWRGYGWYSIFSGLLTLALFFAVIFSAAKFPQVVGVVNRIQIFGSFVWLTVIGLRLNRTLP